MGSGRFLVGKRWMSTNSRSSDVGSNLSLGGSVEHRSVRGGKGPPFVRLGNVRQYRMIYDVRLNIEVLLVGNV
jgi:hypothetical protein